MRASAATDPYTQCGMTKWLCISHFDGFLIHHMPNNYVGVLGMEHKNFQAQINRLLAEVQAE
jgi:hypothetical protein